MKKLSISLIALAALALGACTSDDVALNSDVAKPVEITGDGYVSLAINLPTTPSTRAANDNYDDGLESEYAVNDATLLLFAGNDESSATCYATYNLTTSWDLWESTTDNITSRAQLTQLIDTPESGNIYAMVVLNANGLITNVVGQSLDDLQTTALTLGSAAAMTTTGFFMCNAPLISTAGGVNHTPSTGSVTTLAVIDPESIFSSAAEAEAHPATEIYVERGMAKVTVVDGTGTGATVGSTEIPVTIDGFTLDITNTVSYLVRNTTGAEDWWTYVNTLSGDHRMAGSVEVADQLYRTYWATDPNYSGTGVTGTDADDMVLLEGTTPTLTACADAQGNYNPLYCLENTFDVRHQNDDETTRVIVGATLNNGASFFILNNDKNTLCDQTTIENYILTQMHAEGYMEAAESQWVGPIAATSDMYDYITVELGTLAAGEITFTYSVSEDVVGDWFLSGVVPDVLVEGSTAYDEVVADLNNHIEVEYYANGVSYYPVKIKHFGDDLTPWSADYAATTGTANEKSYPATNELGDDEEDAWLGRYGVLRNNWYEITVTGVSQIGSATVPHAYGLPDDPTEQWISIEINILSWAKRAQSVTL